MNSTAYPKQVIRAYQREFPNDEAFPIEARAELIVEDGHGSASARGVRAAAFVRCGPGRLVTQYFALLKQTNSLRVYLDRARAGVAANPTDLASAVKLFYYWQQQNNLPAAERALAEFRQRKESRKSAWTPDELLDARPSVRDGSRLRRGGAELLCAVQPAGTNDAVAENALASLARMILTAPEQPMHFGSGNFSLYRDVATMDPHPGFLNGVLVAAVEQYRSRESRGDRKSRTQRRISGGRAAAELVALFESRFPEFDAARGSARAGD